MHVETDIHILKEVTFIIIIKKFTYSFWSITESTYVNSLNTYIYIIYKQYSIIS